MFCFFTGYVAREQYKRMRALMVMVKAYRVKKIREYINALELKFRRAKSMKDYGKSLTWPAPPLSLRNSVQIFRKIFNRWRAYMILSKIPKNDWPQMKLKVTAASALLNKRNHYGLGRKWEGNYLSTLMENNNYTTYNDAVNNLKNTKHFGNVLFSSYVTKFNRYLLE